MKSCGGQVWGEVSNRNITEIKKAEERAASLTRQLLAFSRKLYSEAFFTSNSDK